MYSVNLFVFTVMEEDEEQEMLKLSLSTYTGGFSGLRSRSNLCHVRCLHLLSCVFAAPSESVSGHSTVSSSAAGSAPLSHRILF